MAEQQPEVLIRSELIDGEYPDGKSVKLFDLEHRATGKVWTNVPLWSVPPVVAGLLVDYERQEFGVVKESRIGVGGRKLVNAISGRLNEDEDPRDAFAREAEEETGTRPRHVSRVARLVSSPGITDEVKTLCIGSDHADGARTEGEEIETLWFPISELDRMIERTGDGGDQTLYTLLLWLWRDITLNRPELLGHGG